MLLSMTGFGDARFQDERVSASVELRAVNNRYFKISMKCSEAYASLEGDIERIVRETISRGTVHVAVRLNRQWSADEFALNTVALKSYWSQLQVAARELGAAPPTEIGPLLAVPGVVEEETRRHVDLQADGEIIKRLLGEAL
ncbi:MAG: YicC family protein, partial [Planctomycetes bacterium]|nr:YicC family protein [Planctomycetota bacterium]